MEHSDDVIHRSTPRDIDSFTKRIYQRVAEIKRHARKLAWAHMKRGDELYESAKFVLNAIGFDEE